MAILGLVAVAGCTGESPTSVQLEPDLPVVNVEAGGVPGDGFYATPQEMADATKLIVYGTVTGVQSIGAPNAADDPNASEYFVITLEPIATLKGATPEPPTFLWEGFVTDAGTRQARVTLDGVAMPDVGDELVVFLNDESPMRVNEFGDHADYLVETADGIYYVRDGELLTELSGRGRVGHQLNGQRLSELADILNLAGAESLSRRAG